MNALEFDRLVQKYQSLVYTICRQLVADEGYAQDLTQETFLSAWRSMDRCPAGYEKQWLARIASNKAKDYLRSAWARRVNTPGDDVLALEGAPPGSEPEAQVLEALGEEELTQRILALREPYKTPCRLMLLEQHTAAEAARLCGRPQKTVEAQVFRAKKMLAAPPERRAFKMELFREDGCLSDEGLHALTAGQLDELGRLEAAEHLAYCDKCTDRYTALLTADALADPPRDVRRTVMSTIWVRLMQSTYGRAAVAGVAAVLALTMWRTGALTFVTDHGSDLQALLPTVQVTLPEKQPPKILPEKLGRPVTSRPGENIYTRVSSVLESLLNAAENIKS